MREGEGGIRPNLGERHMKWKSHQMARIELRFRIGASSTRYRLAWRGRRWSTKAGARQRASGWWEGSPLARRPQSYPSRQDIRLSLSNSSVRITCIWRSRTLYQKGALTSLGVLQIDKNPSKVVYLSIFFRKTNGVRASSFDHTARKELVAMTNPSRWKQTKYVSHKKL